MGEPNPLLPCSLCDEYIGYNEDKVKRIVTLTTACNNPNCPFPPIQTQSKDRITRKFMANDVY